MKSQRKPFDEGGTFVARKTFRFHGRTYARGAEFPWRSLSCSARKLFQLFDNGFLIPASDLEPAQEPVPAAKGDDSAEAKAERRKEAGRKAAAARKRNAEAKAAAAAEEQAPEAPAGE